MLDRVSVNAVHHLQMAGLETGRDEAGEGDGPQRWASPCSPGIGPGPSVVNRPKIEQPVDHPDGRRGPRRSFRNHASFRSKFRVFTCAGSNTLATAFIHIPFYFID